ncbi:methyltransferase domain-containing protein [Desulfogranum japonicum]|uniref:methyltransferase domain-containing protein n=1 Tax=Desulfogranum japonicum TaxID=231447 RepID=UPI0004155487|nr:methyltransferase domain-containing protein [Desulfogranum japonicum]
MQLKDRATIEFSVQWTSVQAKHNDRIYVGNVDFWRDTIPCTLEQQLGSVQENGCCRITYPEGALLAPCSEKQIRTFPEKMFDASVDGRALSPRLGRFYPQGYAHAGLYCFRQSLQPFRIIEKSGGTLTGDMNHPLCRYPLTVSATLLSRDMSGAERGGSCHDIAELLTADGPGMQARYPGKATDFYTQYPFPRENDGPDEHFYRQPRMVNHLDATALEQIQALYGRLVPESGNILDLMSSWVSHLPDSLQACRVAGLGMNRQELDANPVLHQRVIHDLNREISLPFETNSFDAVICTASIEYLTRPVEVLQEVARVIRPGGISVTTFSDRWFPGKEISIWADLHAFERLGLVLDLYQRTEAFTNLHTESFRGLPRPWDDRHIMERQVSDPIFAVWGTAL